MVACPGTILGHQSIAGHYAYAHQFSTANTTSLFLGRNQTTQMQFMLSFGEHSEKLHTDDKPRSGLNQGRWSYDAATLLSTT